MMVSYAYAQHIEEVSENEAVYLYARIITRITGLILEHTPPRAPYFLVD